MKFFTEAMIFEDMKFRRSLKKLQTAEQAIIDAYGEDIEKARAEQNWEDEQGIASTMFFEQDNVRSEIRSLQHSYVTNQADRLLLPVPKFDTESPDWKYSDYSGRWTLSPEVLARLGREVRQERRERLELVFLWPSAMIGLLGGLIGIFTAFWR
ncbi:hypothetical protein [uncultured Roseobacter sp.]|uniref:hypothetical protein n=1 Tax=uncultured Roseobacter sp. TaxID=114847 RepID=UPI002637B0D0|nr:hypothetical protein [uncultured Roseobacter sp.]